MVWRTLPERMAVTGGKTEGSALGWFARAKAAMRCSPPGLKRIRIHSVLQFLGSPNQGASFDQVQAAVNAGYQHIDYSERKVRAQEYHRFLSQNEG